MSIAKLLVVSLATLEIGTASSFHPNCSLPHEGTNFVSGPNVRGTLSIVWNCLSIIILCSWNILHLNVPEERAYPTGFVRSVWQAILCSLKKFKWMLFTILMPEFLVGKSFSDWWAARDGASFASVYANADKVEWGMIHCYLCDMGGVAVDFSGVPPAQGRPAITMRELVSGVRIVYRELDPSATINLSRMEHKLWVLNNSQMVFARGIGLIAALPDIPTIKLEQLSKTDPLVKFLAVVQVAWLILQLTMRKARSLSITQLEIATLAFSVSSFATYIFSWSKPQGVETVTKIAASRLPNVRETYELSRFGHGYLWTGRRFDSRASGDGDFVPIPNDATRPSFKTIQTVGLGEHTAAPSLFAPDGNDRYEYKVSFAMPFGAASGGAVFGALHCLAWNFRFPTPTDRLLWRLCSILMAALPVLFVLFAFEWRSQNSSLRFKKRSWGRTVTASAIIVLIALPYILARLVILIEIFRDLAFLPPDAYKETWSGAFPHWG